MPLSKPEPRDLMHERRITCRGYRRNDGRWDIEGHLVDTKAYAFDNHDRGGISAGEALHDMWIRLTVDDDLLVHAAEACTDQSPFAICPTVTDRFDRLVGLTVGPGWRHQVVKAFARTEGCTHLTQLLIGPLATTAHQTVRAALMRRHGKTEAGEKPEGAPQKPMIIDSCYAWSADGDVEPPTPPTTIAAQRLPFTTHQAASANRKVPNRAAAHANVRPRVSKCRSTRPS